MAAIVASAIAFAADEPRDPGITSAQATAILDELRQIRQLLENQAKPAPQPQPQAFAAVPQKRSLKLQGDYYSLGSATAPVTMVEFTDYQCPFCRSFEKTTFDQIRKLYIDTGKVRFVSRNLPLDIHKDAMRSAEAALCAGDQGQYWAMREFLFRSPSLSNDAILASARELKVDLPAFTGCVESEKHKAEILRDVQEAQALRMSGTPAFLIGKTTDYGVEGYVTTGAVPFAQFDAKLKASEVQ